MPRLRKVRQQLPPVRTGSVSPSILLLDRFTEKNLDDWSSLSQDLDDYYRILHYSLEPERKKRMKEMLSALHSRTTGPFEFDNWVRMVEARWTLDPLSSAGGLLNYGGRFSVGSLLNDSLVRPFPALYIGENQETAHREMYQVEGNALGGLTVEELDLCQSFSSYRVRGKFSRVFDASNLLNLVPFAAVLKKFKVPRDLRVVTKRLKLGTAESAMIRTPQQLHEALSIRNWRTWAVQFDLPAPSQHFGLWVRNAGFEAIKYRSTKNPLGCCVAVFTDNLSDDSFVELVDPAAPGVTVRLDSTTADQLSGRHLLPSHF